MLSVKNLTPKIESKMTGFQVDANGNRIKTDILTSGYLRQDIEKEFKI